MGKFRKSELMNQHRSGSNNNSINFGTKIEPFRITDGVMKVGKYKGKKLSEIPRDYLEWMIKEMSLSKSRILAIKDILK